MSEQQCNVQLLHNTPLYIGANGARTCWDSGDKSDTHDKYSCPNCGDDFSPMQTGQGEIACIDCNLLIEPTTSCGPNDAALIDRVGNKFKHASILEHISYNFYISDISRALLQELARHRMASYSVKSTRYTLKELKEENPFIIDFGENEASTIFYDRASKYLVWTGVNQVDRMSVQALENLRQIIVSGISNDKAKYCIPESYKTELTWSINARSLQNFLYLRSDKSALWEIRELAQAVYDALPEDHKYLFTDKLRFEENN